MTTNAKQSPWKVLVTLDSTVSAWITVQANSQNEATEKALSKKTILENGHLFFLDSENFSKWAESAYIPDPEEGIFLDTNSEPTNMSLPLKAKEVIKAASKGYDQFGVGIDLADTSNPEVYGDGLAMFLSRELKDVMKGSSEDQCLDEAISAVQRSISQLEDVLKHIENLKE